MIRVSGRSSNQLRRSISPLDAGEIGDRAGRLANFVEQFEPVFAQWLVFHVDRDLVEESVDMGTKLGHGTHRGFKVLTRDRSGCFRLARLDCACQRTLLVLAIEGRVGLPDIFPRVALLFDADDVGGPLVAGKQILAVLGVEESSQRLDTADDRNHACLGAAQMKNGVDQIVPRSLIAQLHFEPLLEKLLKVVACIRNFSIRWIWSKPPDMHFKEYSRQKIVLV